MLISLHIIDVTTYEHISDSARLYADSGRNKSQWLTAFLLASVLAHSLIIIALFYTSTAKAPATQKQKIPLQSYIVFTNPPQTTQIQTTVPKMNEFINEPEEIETVNNFSPSIERKEKQFIDLSDASTDNDAKEAQTSSEAAPLPTFIPRPRITVDDALHRYQAQLNNKAIAQISQQELQNYQRSKVSPQITAPKPMDAADQQILIERIKVDCTDAAKKGLSIISGLLGGTIECNEHVNFQEYIDKRLNKSSPVGKSR